VTDLADGVGDEELPEVVLAQQAESGFHGAGSPK
jgi:hypothetical protein